ncbi:MAG: N-acetylglucosamine-6-phosphate deacetylase [Anaerolineales bacterium]|nr:N-acetylglucosamine-6-phosphate deacetylase [Anaerolineales bacterium]
MVLTLKNANVITPYKKYKQSAIQVSEQGMITYLGPMQNAPPAEGETLDIAGRIIIPGLIDIHVHGGHGITFGQLETLEDDLNAYSEWVVEQGVTGFLTSITAPTAEEIRDLIQAYVPLFEKGTSGAEPLGIHLEGPFMNIEKKGAQNPAWIRDPSLEEAEMYVEAGQGWIRQMTMAPELPHAKEVAALFRKAGIVLSIGHSTADYETAVDALKGDWSHITHTYNAQTGLHHRAPGIVGATLVSEKATAELIADEVHVHPGAMKVLTRCLGTDRVVLVTDAMTGAGLPDGDYELLGFKITVEDGKATQEDGTIAGSVTVLNRCVENVSKDVGVSLAEAVKMASLNPARVLGLSNILGSIGVGKDASLTVIDEDVNVYLTMVKGDIVYKDPQLG